MFRNFLIMTLILFSACSRTKPVVVEPEPVREPKPLSNLYHGSYGIDISEFQGEIDFDTVEQLCDFCFMRASAGTRMLVDNLLEYNYSKAEYSSLRLGYYHYFNYVNDPEAQADLFLSAVKGKRNNFPLVIDIEHSENIFGQSMRSNTQFQVLNNLYFFVEKLKAANQNFIIYTNKRTYRDLDLENNYPDIPIWIADYACDVSNEMPNLCIRQFCCDGIVEGIDADVDLNVMLDPSISND